MATQKQFDLFKSWCRADDFSADDAVLEFCLEAAQEVALRLTARTKDEMLALGGGEWPKDAWLAVMMLGAHYYNQPEAAAQSSQTEAPYSVQTLLKPFRKLA